MSVSGFDRYFPLEIYPQILKFLTAQDIYRYTQVSDPAYRTIQKLAQDLQIEPASIGAFLCQKLKVRAKEYSIKCLKPHFTGSILLLPVATVRDIKIASSRAMSIPFESIKIDIQDTLREYKMYDDDNTSLMQIPMNKNRLISVTVESAPKI